MQIVSFIPSDVSSGGNSGRFHSKFTVYEKRLPGGGGAILRVPIVERVVEIARAAGCSVEKASRDLARGRGLSRQELGTLLLINGKLCLVSYSNKTSEDLRIRPSISSAPVYIDKPRRITKVDFLIVVRAIDRCPVKVLVIPTQDLLEDFAGLWGRESLPIPMRLDLERYSGFNPRKYENAWRFLKK